MTPVPPRRVADRPVRQRSWLEVRWRQLRNPPRPVARAVGSSLAIAALLGLGYLAYDVAVSRGASLPGGDLRGVAAVAYVLGVVVAGTVATWLIVPQPTGASGRQVRSGWSAALGFFAAVPIAYLVLVVTTQVIKPLLV
jgi:hypothetical protein